MVFGPLFKASHFGAPRGVWGGSAEVDEFLCARDLKAIETFTLLLFAYNCHMNVVPVAAEMMNPTDRRTACHRRVIAQGPCQAQPLIVIGDGTSVNVNPHVTWNTGETRHIVLGGIPAIRRLV
eukprot:320911-Amphidinium_carterae.1